MHWLYILIAATFEAGWTFSLKLLDFSKLKELRFNNIFVLHEGIPVIAPLLGYIVFGIGNIYYFSLAMKHIPTATAFAVWTSISIILIKAAEMLFFHQRISYAEIFFIILITVGIIGLKTFASPS